MKADICYWLNHEALSRGIAHRCVNTAVEATTLSDRACSLLAQDRFLRDHIGADDIAVVSIAGNDVALKPLLGTIVTANKFRLKRK